LPSPPPWACLASSSICAAVPPSAAAALSQEFPCRRGKQAAASLQRNAGNKTRIPGCGTHLVGFSQCLIDLYSLSQVLTWPIANSETFFAWPLGRQQPSSPGAAQRPRSSSTPRGTVTRNSRLPSSTRSSSSFVVNTPLRVLLSLSRAACLFGRSFTLSSASPFRASFTQRLSMACLIPGYVTTYFSPVAETFPHSSLEKSTTLVLTVARFSLCHSLV